MLFRIPTSRVRSRTEESITVITESPATRRLIPAIRERRRVTGVENAGELIGIALKPGRRQSCPPARKNGPVSGEGALFPALGRRNPLNGLGNAVEAAVPKSN